MLFLYVNSNEKKLNLSKTLLSFVSNTPRPTRCYPPALPMIRQNRNPI